MLKDQLRKARKQAGKTQKEVADNIGVTESAYCGYETGKREPDALKLRKIAVFLNVSGDYLLELDQPEQIQPALAEDEDHLLYVYNALNDRGRKILITNAESLLLNPETKESSTPKTGTF